MVRAHQFFRLLALWCLCCLGCQDQPSPAIDGLSGNQASVIRQQSEGSEQSGARDAGASGVDVMDENDVTVVTREDLDQKLARLSNVSGWHYGERTPGELAGTWVLADGDGAPLVFGANGSFRQDFNGHLTTGLYAISDSGRIVTFSKWNDIGLGSHFWFDGKTIIGPKGPLPKVEWVREELIE
ncbi:MAG: hypothetical protein ACPGLY_07575 [Rubripirellula sp.]